LGPGGDRLIMFHIISEGGCWVQVNADGRRVQLNEGDVVVLPYGDQHQVGGHEPAEPVSIATLLSMPPWETFPTVEYGGDGPLTEMVCGYLRCDSVLFDPLLRALPSVFSVTPAPGPTATWVNASVQYALEASRTGAFSPMTQRLPELLFVEVLRTYLQERGAELSGWLVALRDPVAGPALAELHGDPAHDWTVAELARKVSVSKSVLDDRFRQLLGRPPIRYLTDWRFQLACSLLRSTDMTVGEVASRVGYAADEAFSRAFKRQLGQSPKLWREAARA
jgi:AraC-like DNA-binding protein